jgi:hypothetical protein
MGERRRKGRAVGIDSGAVAIPRRRARSIHSSPRPSSSREIDLVERGPQSCRQFCQFIVCPEVHEEQARLVIEHVIVQGRNLDAIVAQNTQHRIDFIGGQDEIPGDRGLAAARRLEVDRFGRAHGVWHGQAGIAHRSGAF